MAHKRAASSGGPVSARRETEELGEVQDQVGVSSLDAVKINGRYLVARRMGEMGFFVFGDLFDPAGATSTHLQPSCTLLLTLPHCRHKVSTHGAPSQMQAEFIQAVAADHSAPPK